MLTTNTNQSLNFTASDGTIFVTSGAVVIGNYVMDFKGGYMPFSQMSSFDTTTHSTDNYYQNSVLSVYNFNNFPDLTSAHSDATTLAGLGSFYISNTSSSKPLGLFTFYYDGSNISLKSSSKVF